MYSGILPAALLLKPDLVEGQAAYAGFSCGSSSVDGGLKPYSDIDTLVAVDEARAAGVAA